jgi:nucleotide-binding universal stress UspA family protein
MIGHVATVEEARGRVVLRLGCGTSAVDAAFEAAVRIAKAFDSEIEGLFVEDRQLIELTAYPFAKEISLTGRVSRTLSSQDLDREFRAAFLAIRRRLESVAKRSETRMWARSVRDDPINALARVCAEAGPWNVIVMGEAFGPRDGRVLGEILGAVRDATGLCTVGPRTRRTSGPIVVAVEDPERMLGMMRTAERLAGNGARRGDIIALLVGDNPERLHWLEGQARLLLSQGHSAEIVIARAAYGEPASVAEAIRRTRAGFVIAQYGGLAVPTDDLRPLAVALESPLFLVR